MTFEIGAGVFTVCAGLLVFGLLSSTFKFPHRTGKTVGSLVVESTFTAPPTPTPSPSPTPAAAVLPDTSERNPPLLAPTSQPPASVHPTGGSPKPGPTATPVVDRPPAIVLSVTPSTGSAPLSVFADASRSTDTDGTPIANFVFDFGDGSPSVNPIGGGSRATHTYTVAGGYTITVTAIDTAGHVSTAFATITVRFN